MDVASERSKRGSRDCGALEGKEVMLAWVSTGLMGWLTSGAEIRGTENIRRCLEANSKASHRFNLDRWNCWQRYGP